ncbi:hypothetical protein [Rhodocyclus purpureus]|uniref:hypothetical protein n=1 Tax=Rhodocyclus purpureus TaxID=1067 RepID=UPI0019132FDE|nr:hypothetical protein [Rhodocyclus purpureus]MBK5914649.1 hypothetical protein [Rhodocyclus purpureus]
MTNLQMLVSQHQAKAARMAAQSADWGKRKEKWLAVLARFIEDVRASLIAAGVPGEQIAPTSHHISEEALGDYEAPGLRVKIGTALVQFVPIASVIIGGYGRIDVIGPQGEVKLIAHDTQAFPDPDDKTPSHEREWVWSAYPDKTRRGGLRLDNDGLAKVLELVIGGA